MSRSPKDVKKSKRCQEVQQMSKSLKDINSQKDVKDVTIMSEPHCIKLKFHESILEYSTGFEQMLSQSCILLTIVISCITPSPQNCRRDTAYPQNCHRDTAYPQNYCCDTAYPQNLGGCSIAMTILGVCSIATTILIKFLYYQPREQYCKWPPIANLPISVLILGIYLSTDLKSA